MEREKDTDGVDIITQLEKMGFSGCAGEAHICVYIPLADGRRLRFGVTDDDVAETPGLWVSLLEKGQPW